MSLTPYLDDGDVVLYAGDCVEVMAELPEASVDAVVTDPPYGLEFMGKEWDRLAGWRDGPSGEATLKWESENRHGGFAAIERSRVPRFYQQQGHGPAMQAWHGAWAAEALRVLKPGGHLLAFGGTRTYHRLACALEDAGFEIRDCLVWLYGSGFPKSLDVSKAIDRRRDDNGPTDAVRAWLNARRAEVGLTLDAINKHFGHASNGGGSASSWTTNPTSKALPTWDQWLSLKALCGFGDEMDAEVWRLNGRKGQPGDTWYEREKVGEITHARSGGEDWAKRPGSQAAPRTVDVTAPATPEAAAWQGWGTALKPGHEPIVLARKPLAERTVAAQVLATGTGAVNVDGCRIGMSDEDRAKIEAATWVARGLDRKAYGDYATDGTDQPMAAHPAGRWPANVLLDEAAAELLDAEVGDRPGMGKGRVLRRGATTGAGMGYGSSSPQDSDFEGYGDTGGPSRFFKVVEHDEEDGCPSDRASSAASPSPPPSAPGGSAPSGAATSAPHGTPPSSPERSTAGTASASKPSGASGTPATPSTASGSSPESQVDGRTPIPGRASGAAPSGPTGITTTTGAPPTSDGFAAPATSASTSPSGGPGAQGFEPRWDSRAFYTAKAGTDEREGSKHPTVKPLALMRWLVRLVTPLGGVVLDPFAGSGTTLRAAREEGFRALGIEREAEYLADAAHRLRQLSLFAEGM